LAQDKIKEKQEEKKKKKEERKKQAEAKETTAETDKDKGVPHKGTYALVTA
jgi:hypothetical protein